MYCNLLLDEGQARLSTDGKWSDSFVYCNLLLEVRTDKIVH